MIDVELLQEMTELVLAEAPKKKGKKAKKDDKAEVQPRGYSYAESLDFAPPLGADNLYARQGAANFGPYTAAVGTTETRSTYRNGSEQRALQSAWDRLAESVSPEGTWERALIETKR